MALLYVSNFMDEDEYLKVQIAAVRQTRKALQLVDHDDYRSSYGNVVDAAIDRDLMAVEHAAFGTTNYESFAMAEVIKDPCALEYVKSNADNYDELAWIAVNADKTMLQ
jgi:hypothetical protein